eukprot:scaffold78023_cov19-Tisochrysis_lutea.AAC.1
MAVLEGPGPHTTPMRLSYGFPVSTVALAAAGQQPLDAGSRISLTCLHPCDESMYAAVQPATPGCWDMQDVSIVYRSHQCLMPGTKN